MQILIPPVSEPVTLAEVRAWLRVGSEGDDGVLTGLIRASRQAVEARTGRAMVERTVRQTFAGPRSAGRLTPALGPVTTLKAVRLVTEQGVETVAPAGLVSLVDGRFQVNAAVSGLSLDYVTGYTPVSAIPEGLKQAVFDSLTDALIVRDGGVARVTRPQELPFQEPRL